MSKRVYDCLQTFLLSGIILFKKVFGQHFYKTTEQIRIIKPFCRRKFNRPIERFYFMSKEKELTKKITRAGVIAALYTVTSLVTAPIASGAIQVRLSEALTLLALIFPEAVPALFIGCALSNLITGCAIFDIILGSLITLVAATLTYAVGRIIKNTAVKVFIGGLFPVLLNAFLLPLIWMLCYGTGEYVYILQVVFLCIGQGVSVYALGIPLIVAINKRKV